MSKTKSEQSLLDGNEIPFDSDQKGTFAERLQLLIGSESGRKFAAKADIVYSTLHNYLTGLNVPTMENLIKIANATNVDLNWLVTSKGSNNQAHRLKDSQEVIKDTLGHLVDLAEFYFVPKYSVKASAGHGAVVENEEPMHQVAFRRRWVDNTLCINPKGLAVLEVKGDSMEPEINNKDILLINTYDNSLRDGIYVLRSDGDLIVKRIQKHLTGAIEIISANPVYKTMTLNIKSLPDDFAVIGRVVWFGRTLP